MGRWLTLAVALVLATVESAATAVLDQAATGGISGRVVGRFDVNLAPQTQPGGVPNGRMTMRKTFRGPLSGTSSGEMLTSSDATSGSGAYVAVEQFTGRLGDRSGSFYFVHRGIIDGGRPDLSITVVPGSGTGELAGLTGTLHLDLASKDHAFALEYSLPPRTAD